MNPVEGGCFSYSKDCCVLLSRDIFPKQYFSKNYIADIWCCNHQANTAQNKNTDVQKDAHFDFQRKGQKKNQEKLIFSDFLILFFELLIGIEPTTSSLPMTRSYRLSYSSLYFTHPDCFPYARNVSYNIQPHFSSII